MSILQIFFGVHGLKPSEVVIDFVTDHHKHFSGGVFFISAENEHFMIGAENKIKEVINIYDVWLAVCFKLCKGVPIMLFVTKNKMMPKI